ncbi:MAG: (2Fe-2S)-binding protein [Deltaproteobacteria bacterium]|nr:(2Fe-2S)-binding protein [Deltaproteobacteria bacterium]
MYIRIDGKQVEAKKWDTILSAARRADIDIPSLCHHPALETVGTCRLCIVEVMMEGLAERKVVTACETKVAANMEVYTRTESIRKARRTTLDLLMARAPHSEVLQTLSVKNGLEPRMHPVIPEANDCVLCLLCVRACEQMGCNAISVSGRGESRSIAPPFLSPPDACVGCGACARICPTNCIEMTDSPTTRTIWGKSFERTRCESCGAPMMPVAYRQYAIAQRDLPEDYYAQCQECKRKEISLKYADLVVKVQHG